MANVDTDLSSPEAMNSLMDNHKSFGLQDNCKNSNYSEVQLRNKTPNDSSETQRKKRAKNRLSNRRSTGFVFEEDVAAALKMVSANNENGEKTKQ